MRHSRWHDLVYKLGLMSIFLLLLGNDENAEAGSDSSTYYYNYSNASLRQLRFQDFEPRQQQEQQEDPLPFGDRREGRGFHFTPTGEDVSVEMEFIVPFLKIPSKRGMKLARNAVQGILNLQKGALLNTAVIVAAGAVIAGIVRLVLAPLVFTSISNGYGYGYGYGYNAKQFEESSVGSNTISRGMRSLTQVLETQLEENKIDVSVCAQRAICQYLQQNAAQLQRMPASSLTSPSPSRLIDVLANSPWMDSLLNGTAVFGAINVARSSHSCGHIYRSCSWPQLKGGVFQRAWPNLLQFFKGYLFF